MSQRYAAGQVWRYHIPPGFESSRIVIGAVDEAREHGLVICVMILGAPIPWDDNSLRPLDIPFLAFSKTAFEETLGPSGALEGRVAIPPYFAKRYREWQNNLDGLGVCTTSFPRIIRQMLNQNQRRT